MNQIVNQVNQKIARKVYANYLLKSFVSPFIISVAYILCALLISKYFFSQMPLWYFAVLVCPILVLFIFTFLNSRKLFFSQQELSAYIDYKTSSEGKYLTAYELDTKFEPNMQKEVLMKTSQLLPLSTPWRTIFTYLSILALLFMIIRMLPPTFLKVKGESGELLAIEKNMLEDLKNAKVISPEIAEELQKELDKLKEDFKENGINKENWEKKQAIGQKLDEALLEQQKIQEKLQAQMEQLEKSISASEKMEEIAKEIHALEASLALNEFAKQSEDIKDAEKELEKLLKENKDKGNQLTLKEKLKLLEALKKVNKGMQDQNEASKDCELCQGELKEGDGKEGIGKLAARLSELAKRLDQEAKECENCMEGEGDDIATEGGGTAKLNLTNQAKPELTPLNLEEFNKGGQFNSEGNLVDVSEGKHDKYTIDTQKNEQRNFQDTGTDIVNDQKVIPNRRDVIKKYFKRESNQEK